MPDILRAKKDSVGKILKKDPRLHKACDRLEAKAADSLHALIDLPQLRNAIRSKAQPPQRREALTAPVLLMSRLQRLPACGTDLTLSVRIRCAGNWIARV